jgi:hypothetical protein
MRILIRRCLSAYFWTHGDLKPGNELRVRVVKSDSADSGEAQNQCAENRAPDAPKQTCLSCDKARDDKTFLMVSRAGAICGKCVDRAKEFRDALANR